MPVVYLPVYVPSGQEGAAAAAAAHSTGVQHSAAGPGHGGHGGSTYPSPIAAAAAAAAGSISVGASPRNNGQFYPNLDCRQPGFGFVHSMQNPRILNTTGGGGAGEPPRQFMSHFGNLSLSSDGGGDGSTGGGMSAHTNLKEKLKDIGGGGGGGGDEDVECGDKNRLLKYKTQLCRWYLSLSYCPHGVNCLFAHGLPELREVRSHSLYKTKPCRNYHLLGVCAYADKCRYYHDAGEKRAGGTGGTGGTGGGGGGGSGDKMDGGGGGGGGSATECMSVGGEMRGSPGVMTSGPQGGECNGIPAPPPSCEPPPPQIASEHGYTGNDIMAPV